jgi:hypothetical protein
MVEDWRKPCGRWWKRNRFLFGHEDLLLEIAAGARNTRDMSIHASSFMEIPEPRRWRRYDFPWTRL